MSMRRDWALWSRDQQTPGHPQVHNPLCRRFVAAWLAQLANNVLAGPMDAEDASPRQAFGLGCGRCFEGLFMSAEPSLYDAIAAHARIHPSRNRLYFGQLWHSFILERNQSNCVLAGCVVGRRSLGFASTTASSIQVLTETRHRSGIFLSGVPADRPSSVGWK